MGKADEKADAARRADAYSRALDRGDVELARATLNVVRAYEGDAAAGKLMRDEFNRRTGGTWPGNRPSPQ